MLGTLNAYRLGLNRAKWAELCAMAQAYAAEQADHLPTFNHEALFGNIDKQAQFRDAVLDSHYISPHKLQVRLWTMALQDADETVLKKWASLAVD